MDIPRIALDSKSAQTMGGSESLDSTFPLVIQFKRIGEFRNMKNVLLVLMFSLLFALVFVRGIDISIANQDTMLCESALKSGNREYLKTCACYYSSGDISCLEH